MAAGGARPVVVALTRPDGPVKPARSISEFRDPPGGPGIPLMDLRRQGPSDLEVEPSLFSVYAGIRFIQKVRWARS